MNDLAIQTQDEIDPEELRRREALRALNALSLLTATHPRVGCAEDLFYAVEDADSRLRDQNESGVLSSIVELDGLVRRDYRDGYYFAVALSDAIVALAAWAFQPVDGQETVWDNAELTA